MGTEERGATENLQLLADVNPSRAEAWFLLGVLARTAPEEFRMAVLELRTRRIKDAEERATRGHAE